jgi:hypothetical protein
VRPRSDRIHGQLRSSGPSSFSPDLLSSLTEDFIAHPIALRWVATDSLQEVVDLGDQPGLFCFAVARKFERTLGEDDFDRMRRVAGIGNAVKDFS